jgi:hypothetical protein
MTAFWAVLVVCCLSGTLHCESQRHRHHSHSHPKKPTTVSPAQQVPPLAPDAPLGDTCGGGCYTIGEATVSYEVDLIWYAPDDSADPVVGYNVYRSASGAGEYALLNTEVVTVTGFADMTPVIEVSYDYVVTSVDANGVESVPSNVYTAAIP